jgi:selenocysteine lyase/cysteine desulfurase
MHTELYLDTARLGRMCRRARLAEQDFCWLVSQLGSSLYLERFLNQGFRSLPTRYRQSMLGLSAWRGIGRLKSDFRRFVNADGGHVFFCSQSRPFIEMAAACLFGKADTVLTTDLAWPPYLACLRQLAEQRGKRVVTIRLLDELIDGTLSTEDLVCRITRAYDKHGCNGLFLACITYLGIRLPVQRIVRTLRRRRRPSFVLLDGAQALGHEPVCVRKLGGDLLLAGTQKWMQAYHPLRVAVSSHRVKHYVRHIASKQVNHLDALHEFTSAGFRSDFGETVELVSLITAAASLSELKNNSELRIRWRERIRNRKLIQAALSNAGMDCVPHRMGMDSGVLLVRSRVTTALKLRSELFEEGIVASGFRDLLRLSMPDRPLTDEQIETVTSALSRSVLV